MSLNIEKFVFIDNHAHSILKNHRTLDEIGFRQCFSESRSLTLLKDHMPRSIHYMDLLDHLERIFNVKTEQDFLAFRSTQTEHSFVQMLWDDVSIGALIIDDGFNKDQSMSLDELADVSGRPIYHCKRIEGLMETCMQNAESFADLQKTYEKELFKKAKRKPVSLKTICAYRGGLELLQPSQNEASKDFDRLKKEHGTKR
ncbi:MAG: hypothetical protein K2X97_01675, partial [Mycobacteriaceae bacterium]|nr:hypothetical protein [Mycobacteriaceae bacterium]